MSRPPEDFVALSRAALAGREPRRIERPEAMPAAVLVPLIHHGGSDRVILTVRSYDVEHHKGQISFPGGAVHAADADLATTALRETWEEIGVKPEDVELFGQLDDIVTISNFVVAPFVGAVRGGPYEFVPNPLEVAEVIEPPIAHLLDPANLVWEEREGVDTVVRSPAYLYEGHRIWGATARMLHGFLDLLIAARSG
ncbi:MAG TPA: CoA pyrophosphatase [Dehalococcoidia bacterium]|nr:CoA pyrophosphatase [Dehalococcoidia bacterium]